MNKHQAHDVLHQWYGGKTENCPASSCSGKMSDSEVMAEAKKIAETNFKPRTNPTVPYDQRIMSYTEEEIAAKKKAEGEAASAGDTLKEHKEEIEAETKEPDFRSMVDLFSFAEKADALPSVIKVIPVGKYKMNKYGEVNITKEMITEMKKHFDEGVRAGGKTSGLPIDIEHGTTQYKDAAAGWIKNLEVRSDGGYATVEWTSLGKQLLKEKLYKFYSPEYWMSYTDPENNDLKLKNVMTGGGLVNKPMIKHDLNAIVNSETDGKKSLTKNESTPTIYLEQEKPMKLSEILAKKKEDRTSEEQAFVVTHKEEMTFAEAKAEGFATETTAKEKETTGVILQENQTIVDKDKMDQLIALAEKGKTAAEKLDKAELRAKVEKAVFSENGVKLPADQVDKWTDKLFKMSEEDQKEALEMLAALPEKQIFGETGTTKEVKGGTAAGIDLDKRAKEIASEKKIAYSEAMKEAVAENPAQYQEYHDNMPVVQQER